MAKSPIKQYYGVSFDVLGQRDFMSALKPKRVWERGRLIGRATLT